MSKKVLQIEFDSNGNLMDQAWGVSQTNNNGRRLETAQDFDDRMEYVKIISFHKRETRAYFKSITTGRQYSMYIDNFNECILAKQFIDNHLQGTWRFIKKGTGQTIKLLLPPKP